MNENQSIYSEYEELFGQPQGDRYGPTFFYNGRPAVSLEWGDNRNDCPYVIIDERLPKAKLIEAISAVSGHELNGTMTCHRFDIDLITFVGSETNTKITPYAKQCLDGAACWRVM